MAAITQLQLTGLPGRRHGFGEESPAFTRGRVLQALAKVRGLQARKKLRTVLKAKSK